jgi:hypothetical protein
MAEPAPGDHPAADLLAQPSNVAAPSAPAANAASRPLRRPALRSVRSTDDED